MPLRRVFLLGAAAVVSVAALVAIGTVLGGHFGETERKLFATLATTFAAGSTVIAGLACLGRDASRPVAATGIVLAALGFALWSAQIWGGYDSGSYWKLLGVLTAWSVALLIAMTTRLMVVSPRLVSRLYPATAVAAALAALVVSAMIVRDNGDGWQFFAIFLILALLGEVLAPILERYAASEERPSERVLGVIAGAEVVAVRGRDARSVQIGDRAVRLETNEMVVLRPLAR